MTVILTSSGRPSSPSRRSFGLSLFQSVLVLTAWVLAWTVIFSAIDFWTLKLWDVSHYSWFNSYRSVMRYGVSWVSPPSFALAENTYFIWMNIFDRDYEMHEWDFYSGNPINPDGQYNFVWGDGHGGWMKFPMLQWYQGWALPTLPWLVFALLLLNRRRLTVPGGWVLLRLAQWLPRPGLSDPEEG